MKSNSVANRRPCSRKPSPSFTPLTGAIVLLVTGPIWILARVVGWVFSLPEQASIAVRLWAAPHIDAAIKALSGDRS